MITLDLIFNKNYKIKLRLINHFINLNKFKYLQKKYFFYSNFPMQFLK